ncbi:hypothetical protein C487_03673 [Natrinema pallidum DSM 3751]|uniref:Uncharacterized protein n=1 Tax=Natrinema pallidum DSM 3751 TaxID=1227495 RepID=L9Z5H8_9EURY|nr:hypothetical protein C487_03673 [Natrinema pallidum DSM 3751]
MLTEIRKAVRYSSQPLLEYGPELSEPCPSPERVTVPLLERNEDGLNYCSAMMDFIIMSIIVFHIKKMAFTIFDQ